MSKKAKYKRISRGGHTKDDRGVVRVRLALETKENGSPRYTYATGNMSRSITLHNAKVSEIYEIIDRALSGEQA